MNSKRSLRFFSNTLTAAGLALAGGLDLQAVGLYQAEGTGKATEADLARPQQVQEKPRRALYRGHPSRRARRTKNIREWPLVWHTNHMCHPTRTN